MLYLIGLVYFPSTLTLVIKLLLVVVPIALITTCEILTKLFVFLVLVVDEMEALVVSNTTKIFWNLILNPFLVNAGIGVFSLYAKVGYILFFSLAAYVSFWILTTLYFHVQCQYEKWQQTSKFRKFRTPTRKFRTPSLVVLIRHARQHINLYLGFTLALVAILSFAMGVGGYLWQKFSGFTEFNCISNYFKALEKIHNCVILVYAVSARSYFLEFFPLNNNLVVYFLTTITYIDYGLNILLASLALVVSFLLVAFLSFISYLYIVDTYKSKFLPIYYQNARDREPKAL